VPDGGSVFYWRCERTAYSAPLWSGSMERVRADPHTHTHTHTHTHSHSKPDACHHMELFKNGHSPSQKSNINSLSQWLLRQHWIIAQGEQWHTHTHIYDLITNYWKLWIFSISDRIERELKGLFSKRFALGPRYYINHQVATQHNIKIVYCIKEKQNKMCVFILPGSPISTFINPCAALDF